MRQRRAALPAAFSLLQSEYNAFLFAPLGEADGDSFLTVLSALTRAGHDPWQEASLLQKLSRDRAVRRLAAVLQTLPDMPWTMLQAQSEARRLVALLPRRSSLRLRWVRATRRLPAALSRMVRR